MRSGPAAVFLAALAVVSSGCHAPGPGSASVYVKDAATDTFQEVHLVFTRVEAHVSDPEDGDNGNSSAGWTVIFENTTGLDVDLLATAGEGTAALLGEADLAAGRYTQIRIHVADAYGIQNGTRVDIEVPNPVLRVVKSFNVSSDTETRIVIDVDLDRSLRESGPRGWRLTPVIGKTTIEQVNDTRSGEDAHTPGRPTDV